MAEKHKEPVRLREKPLAGGGSSLYLDIYSRGRRSYEFLRLYLVPEHTRADREKNRETLRIARTVQARRLLEVQSGAHDVAAAGRKVALLDWFGRCMEGKTGGTLSTWNCTRLLIARYDARPGLTLADVSADWLRGFVQFLALPEQGLAANTQWLYFSKLKAALNRAVADGLLLRNPAAGVEGPRKEETEREYLTLDELRRMSATPCACEWVRRAFLFSCLTGLRKSDVEALRYEQLQRMDGRVRLLFRQRKTGGREYLDLSAQAAALAGDGAEGPVFGPAPSPNKVSHELQLWAANAGIRRRITFHCARHTFAVLMLDAGVDIYTVSKLLGHRDLSVTQIYAHMLDKNKQAAIDRMPEIL